MKHNIKKSLIETYDQYAQDRDKGRTHEWKIQEQGRFMSLLKAERKRTVLEIGAGPGKMSQFFRDNGFEVTSTDISSEMIRLCREKDLPACVMDFCNMAFPDKSFDAVWALNCLLHVPKKELPEALESIRDVLKPTGLFYMGVYGGREFEGIWGEDYYTPKRFFSFYPDEQIKEVVGKLFGIQYFNVLDPGQDHFQSMILRKTREN